MLTRYSAQRQDIRIITRVYKHIGCDCMSVLYWHRLLVTATRWVVCVVMYVLYIVYSLLSTPANALHDILIISYIT